MPRLVYDDDPQAQTATPAPAAAAPAPAPAPAAAAPAPAPKLVYDPQPTWRDNPIVQNSAEGAGLVVRSGLRTLLGIPDLLATGANAIGSAADKAGLTTPAQPLLDTNGQ